MSSSPPAGVREAAARWFAARRGNSADEAAFSAWMSADPAHAEAYARMERHFSLSASIERRPTPRRDHRVAAMAAAAAAAVLLLLPSRPPAEETRIGEQRALALGDGSRLMLDTATRVEPAYTGDERRIRLIRGRARFDVAHGDPRPFIVVAGALSVRAIGTRFDVRLEPGRAEVVLLEGQVEVGTARARRRLVPGDAALTVATGLEARPADLPAAHAWPAGRLVFGGTRLDAVVAEVSRYAVRPIVLADPALGSRRVTASFLAADTRRIAQTLAASERLPLRAESNRLVLGEAPADDPASK